MNCVFVFFCVFFSTPRKRHLSQVLSFFLLFLLRRSGVCLFLLCRGHPYCHTNTPSPSSFHHHANNYNNNDDNDHDHTHTHAHQLPDGGIRESSQPVARFRRGPRPLRRPPEGRGQNLRPALEQNTTLFCGLIVREREQQHALCFAALLYIPTEVCAVSDERRVFFFLFFVVLCCLFLEDGETCSASMRDDTMPILICNRPATSEHELRPKAVLYVRLFRGLNPVLLYCTVRLGFHKCCSDWQQQHQTLHARPTNAQRLARSLQKSPLSQKRRG